MFDVKKSLLLVALMGAIGLAGCNKANNDSTAKPAPASSASTATTETANTENALAIVNGVPITKELFDVYSAQRMAGRPAGAKENSQIVLDDLINREVIYQNAVKEGLDKTPEVQAQLENQLHNVLASAAVRKQLDASPPTEDALQKEYEKLKTTQVQEYNAKHILVATEDEAKAVITELDQGGDFAAIAKEKSTDTGSGATGGDLGWFMASQMVKPFSDALIAMEKGTYSKVPVQSQFGFHVIRLEDSRAKEPPSFEEAKQDVRNIMLNEQVQTYVADLTNKAKIEIFKDRLEGGGSDQTKSITLPEPAPQGSALDKPATPAP